VKTESQRYRQARDIVVTVLAGESGKPRGEIHDFHDLEKDIGLDSLDQIEAFMAIEDELSNATDYAGLRPSLNPFPEIDGEMRVPTRVQELIDLVAVWLDPGSIDRLRTIEQEIIAKFYPDLVGTAYRLDLRSFLLRRYFQTLFFENYAKAYALDPQVILREYLDSFPDREDVIRYLFSIPVYHTTRGETFIIICFLAGYVWIIELAHGGAVLANGKYLMDEVRFGRYSGDSEEYQHFDRISYVIETMDRRVFLDIPDEYKAIALKRLELLKELPAYISDKRTSATLRARQNIEEIEYSYGSLVPRCIVGVFDEFPLYLVTRTYVTDFLRSVRTENDFIDLVLAPMIRAEHYDIEQLIRHGTSDTSQEKGKDIVAVSQFGLNYEVGELVKAFVVKLGAVRQSDRRQQKTVAYHKVVEQICTLNSHIPILERTAPLT